MSQCLTHLELGVVGIFFEVSEEDNPAFDAILSVLEDIERPKIEEDQKGDCQQKGYRLKKDLHLDHLIPFSKGL